MVVGNEREGRSTLVAPTVAPAVSGGSARAREALRFDAWNHRVDEQLAAYRASPDRPLPRKRLDQLCAAHVVLKRMVCRLPETPTPQETRDLERAWRDIENAWDAVRVSCALDRANAPPPPRPPGRRSAGPGDAA